MRHFRPAALLPLGLAAAMIASLAACSSDGARRSPLPSVRAEAPAATSVNRYLWQASLETINFMPLFSVDPVAGVIITDWYASPTTPGERFKANVYVLDTALRADALRVQVFKQVPIQTPNGGLEWVSADVNPATAAELENAILTRARELRLNSMG